MSSKANEQPTTGGQTRAPNGIEISGEANEPSDGDGLARDKIFDVLSNERRRYALDYLKRHDDRTVALRELVDHIAATENEIPEEALHYEQRKRVYSSLRQTHLPRLADFGLIEYNEDRGEVRLNGTAKRVQMHMEYVPEDDIAWCYHYLGLTGILGVVTALTFLGIFPFGELPLVVLVAVAILSFGVSAVLHTAYTEKHTLGSMWEREP